jgi:hypothetical protein
MRLLFASVKAGLYSNKSISDPVVFCCAFMCLPLYF